MYLYRIEFFDLRDVYHEVNVLAESDFSARVIFREYFPDVRIRGMFLFVPSGCGCEYLMRERSFALNAYQFGIYPEIKNR